LGKPFKNGAYPIRVPGNLGLLTKNFLGRNTLGNVLKKGALAFFWEPHGWGANPPFVGTLLFFVFPPNFFLWGGGGPPLQEKKHPLGLWGDQHGVRLII